MTPEQRALLTAMMSGVDLPALVPTRPAWMAAGACRERPDVEFVPRLAVTEANAAEAKAVCAQCEARTDCLEYALADPGLLGVWAGTTTAERREMRKHLWAA